MTALHIAEMTPAIGIGATKHSPVIIATDGEDQSAGALAVGRLLAGPTSSMRLVSVVRPMPVVTDADAAEFSDVEQARRAEMHRVVIDQTTREYGAPIRPEICAGDPAATIARAAHEAGASLIVCGLGRHNVVDRILGDETALRLVRLADAPVLAVARDQRGVPGTIVVACDFSEASLRAARLAVALAAPKATIYLVHVAPRDHNRFEWNGWGKRYRQDALDALRMMKRELRPENDTIVQPIMLDGDIAEELLRFAHSVHADLLATGSHGRGFIARLLVGSVATRILRAATCSVLTVPQAAALAEERTISPPPHGRAIPRDDWATELAEFTRRNRGRPALLEADDADIGAQAQLFDYPLYAAVYDHKDSRVSLMFDSGANVHHRLTRGIAQPSSIDVLRDARGGDIALRIAHGRGQTLLTFVS